MIHIGEQFKPLGVWRGIDYGDLYCISSHGRVVSLHNPFKPRYCKKHIVNGYYRINLVKDGVNISAQVHQLVAARWCVQFSPFHDTVEHNDGDKLHNSWWNIQYMKRGDNTARAHTGKRGRSYRSYANAVIEATNTITGERLRFSGKEGAEAMGFSYNMVYLCLTNIRKAHKGYTFTDTGKREYRKRERLSYSERFKIQTSLGRFDTIITAAIAHNVAPSVIEWRIRNLDHYNDLERRARLGG